MKKFLQNKLLKKQYRKGESIKESTLTAYIIRGNRQLKKRVMKASKKFRVGRDTYIIKENAIFHKVINGKLKSVIHYREGNPNPYDLESEHNYGLSSDELSKVYAEDVYRILMKSLQENKYIYIGFLVLVSTAIAFLNLIHVWYI